ncbi:putative effector protein [Blumeria hordei DH14]|uniref:Putative effector protein n=1 Tax=Blumeria graminis f. sp. hordei (strain DH14) TaxID=546991 RepID=N1JE84_BLUG1|nr:putative effector protein [Blumeria hordei DH14]
MQCAIAFLLLSAKDPKNMDRLIVTQFETNESSYGVYELTSGRTFPHPKLIHQPGEFWESEMENGTHIMSYCSDLLQSHEIVYKITRGMTDITSRAHLHWNENFKAESDCLESLKSVINPEENNNVNTMSKFSSRVKSKCTNQVILNLAFSGIIAVDGEYRKYAPPKADQPIVVTLDQPMKLRSLLLNGELIKGTKTAFGQEALAWYQGHLHLFKRNGNSDAWLPVTTIGHENYNGWQIANFIGANFPKMINSWQDYCDKCAEYRVILRKLSRSETGERNNWSESIRKRQSILHDRYIEFQKICPLNSDNELYRYRKYYYTSHFFDKIEGFNNAYDYDDNKVDDKTAGEYERTIYPILNKLRQRKLDTSLASGVTMAM